MEACLTCLSCMELLKEPHEGRLSLERAMSVADYLIASGLSKAQVSAAGYGPNRPAVEGTTKQALQKNRRVEILMIER